MASLRDDQEKRNGIFILIIAILYLIALVLPVAYDTTFSSQWRGLNFLEVGWLGGLGMWFAWFSNPLLLWALIAIFYKKYMQGLVTSLIAFLLGLQTLFIFSQQPVYVPDASELTGLGAGYWLWQSVLFIVIFYCLVYVPKSPKNLDIDKKRTDITKI